MAQGGFKGQVLGAGYVLLRCSLLLSRLELAVGAQMLTTTEPNVQNWVTEQHKESRMLAAGQGRRQELQGNTLRREWDGKILISLRELLTLRSLVLPCSISSGSTPCSRGELW